jgi:hypothetical protein
VVVSVESNSIYRDMPQSNKLNRKFFPWPTAQSKQSLIKLSK